MNRDCEKLDKTKWLEWRSKCLTSCPNISHCPIYLECALAQYKQEDKNVEEE